ncbi:MAG: hypothetical protein M3173_02265 [Chloroflexota bacterium]|nr:hypothetical protein [Chloroflexota bacterium]
MEGQERPKRTLLRPVSWAAGHRAALVIVVDLDPQQGTEHTGSWHSHLAGADRLLTMLADFDITPTVVVDPETPYPVQLAEGVTIDAAVRSAGAGVDGQLALQAVRQRLGTELRGVMLGVGEPAERLELDGLWAVERASAPFPERTERGTIVIPYTVWWHDAIWFDATRPSPPSAMLESWSLSLASVRTRGELMVVTLSATVAGLPGAVETVHRFLDEAVGAGDVWITNATAVAGHASSASRESQE